MTRLAAIDIGTNSTKMTIADVDPNGSIDVIAEDSDVTRLGQGVDQTKRLSDDAMARTRLAIVRFAEAARQAGAATVLAVGTSALRDASNGSEFIAQVKQSAGVDIEVISGDREAQLAFTAVRSDAQLASSNRAPLLMFDIGGGSTELILGTDKIDRYCSLNIGAVRLSERFLVSDPPSDDEIARASALADNELSQFAVTATTVQLVGIGGTAVNIASVMQYAAGSAPGDVHGTAVSADDVRTALARFRELPVAQRREIPGLDPKRADVIIGGALVLDRLLAHFGADQFKVGTRGVRYGLLAEFVRR